MAYTFCTHRTQAAYIAKDTSPSHDFSHIVYLYICSYYNIIIL